MFSTTRSRASATRSGATYGTFWLKKSKPIIYVLTIITDIKTANRSNTVYKSISDWIVWLHAMGGIVSPLRVAEARRRVLEEHFLGNA